MTKGFDKIVFEFFKENYRYTIKVLCFFGKSIEIASKISDSVTGQLEKFRKGILLSTASTVSEMSSSQGGI